MTDATVGSLAPSGIADATGVLIEAFASDPFAMRIYRDVEQRRRGLAATTRLVLRYAIARGEVHVAGPGIRGVAAWLPPSHATASVWDMVRFGFFLLPFHMGWQPFRAILAYVDHTAAMRKRHVRGPHWYLQMLGVDPAHRGGGYGSLLLRTMLERLDRQQTPCCLDTENGKNVALYEHFGFQMREQSEIPGGGPCWLMVREVGGRR